MKRRHTGRFFGSLTFAILAAAAFIGAATPPSGTLSPTSGSVSWDGFAVPLSTVAVTSDGEGTCTEGTNCDTFTLKLAPADYRGKRVRFKASWTAPLNDYDVYVHQGDNAGAVVGTAASSPPGALEEGTFDVNAVVTAGVNDVYTVHVVYFTVAGPDPYHGVATLEDIPVTPTRTATIVSGSKSGLAFSHSRALYAWGATKDVEPSVRVDYQGNGYVGGIRGLTGGNDIWRFDLNPASPTYDPFLIAATPKWSADGSIVNPAWKRQPDAWPPNDAADLGGDGGGDLDMAVSFRPPVPTTAPPILATSSLVAANVSVQKSTDRGETWTNNPSGNTTMQVDDRQWMEFLGDHVVYLAYRDFTGLQATSKYYVNRSDDGGLTYGPAVVAAVGGSTTGNIDVDQRDGTVYFCFQGPGSQNNQVLVAVGQPVSLAVAPVTYTTHVAATGQGTTISALFPVCKVASDGTVYVAYSDDGTGIYITHSFDQGRTWAPPIRVSDVGPNGVALMPWIETGDRPGSLAIAWYGATAADSEGGVGGNSNASNWKVFFAQTLNATSSSPTIYQTVASDHFIHGSNISLKGLSDDANANRNLADFFQIALDPHGMALIAFADDSNDFSGNTYAVHQTAGYNLNTGKPLKIKGANPVTDVTTKSPQVYDFRHDARVVSPPPVTPDVDTPADILTVGYTCQSVNGSRWISATMRLSGLDEVPPHGIWRMHFASNPTKPGVVDRADQWFVQAATDDTGARSFSWGTAARLGDGSIAYTVVGPADAGVFDLASRSITVKVDVAKLNAVQTRGPITSTTPLIGLRGSTQIERYSQSAQGIGATVGLTDSTRGGGTFTMGSCPL